MLQPPRRRPDAVDRRKLQRHADLATLCAIHDKIERRKPAPAMFEGPELAQLLVAAGAPLDIDDDEPIDLEPRFFLPADGLSLRPPGPMPAREPIPLHRLRARGRPGRQDCARTALADATRTARHCETAAWRSSRWITHRYVRERNRPAAAVTDRASGLAHCFVAGSYRMWPRGVGEWAYDPDVPHAIGTVYDSTSPRHGAVLRSELLFAVSLLKASVEDSNMFINHKTCPALVVSFHGRFSARILQVHLQNGRMVVRPSRLLDLHTRTASRDVQLAIRWLDCRPLGDTRWLIPDPIPLTHGAAGAEPDKGHPPRQAIAAVQLGASDVSPPTSRASS